MASPVTIQPSTADTYLFEAVKTTNYGTNVVLKVYHLAGSHEFSLCSFDFHAFIPTGATITVATLSLYCTASAAGRTISVYRLLRTNWVEAQATWNIYKTGSSWGTAGALNITDNPDYTITDAVAITAPAYHVWGNWDVTNQVKTALASVGGVAHFLIKDTGADADSQQNYSSNNAVDTTKCPKLYIEYTVPSTVLPNFLPFFWA